MKIKGKILSEERRRVLADQGVNSMESFRISALSRFGIALFVILVLIAVGIVLIAVGISMISSNSSDSSEEVWTVIVTGLIVLVMIGVMIRVLVGWAGSPSKKMLAAYDQWRSMIVIELTNDANATFEPQQNLSDGDFHMIHHRRDYNIFQGNNMIKFGALRAGYVNVQREYEVEHTVERDGKTETETETKTEEIWDGVIIVSPAPLPTSAGGAVEIRSDGLSPGMTEIRIAHPHISTSRYRVGTSSDLIAHRTLTPVIQTAIWDYHAELGRGKESTFVYRNQLLYVGIPNLRLDFGKNPSIFFSITRQRLNTVISTIEETIRFLSKVETLLPS